MGRHFSQPAPFLSLFVLNNTCQTGEGVLREGPFRQTAEGSAAGACAARGAVVQEGVVQGAGAEGSSVSQQMPDSENIVQQPGPCTRRLPVDNVAALWQGSSVRHPQPLLPRADEGSPIEHVPCWESLQRAVLRVVRFDTDADSTCDQVHL